MRLLLTAVAWVSDSERRTAMKKDFKLVKRITAGAVFCILTAVLTACGTTELDHYDNQIKQEQKYEETISDTKQNDRETEEMYEEIIDEAGDEAMLPADTSEVVTVADASSGETKKEEVVEEAGATQEVQVSSLRFRKQKYLDEHYEKHGKEMGFANAEDYLAAANAVVANPEALHKKEKEDNDDIYYVESTNEFVVVSSDGYIRTYFNPSAGINYYNRQ